MFTRFGDWKPAEVEVLLARVRSELRNNQVHLYTKMFVTLGIPFDE